MRGFVGAVSFVDSIDARSLRRFDFLAGRCIGCIKIFVSMTHLNIYASCLESTLELILLMSFLFVYLCRFLHLRLALPIISKYLRRYDK